nr:hypothetical protein [uncultured Massilia sp.]
MARDHKSEKREPGRIVRHAGIRTLHAWHWHSLAQLQAVVGWRDPRACLFADMTLGAWRGHWLARELAPQLGLPEPGHVQPALLQDASHHAQYADTVGRLIDNESRGDVNIIAALAQARAIAARLRARRVRHVLVAAPLPGHAWGSENLQLLRLLCDAAPDHAFRIGLLLRGDGAAPEVPGLDVLVHTHPRAVDAGTQPWCSIPGLLDPALVPAGALDAPGIETIRLAAGQVLLSPNCRPVHGTPALAPPGLPDSLRVPFALRAAEQDVAFLQREAGLRFAEGAYELAYAILDGIRPQRLSQLQEALVAAQRQNIAIALMDFARAARGPVPDAGLPAEVQASLCQSRAWGLVMSGRPEDAEPLFARACALLDADTHPRLYLYLLNISALNKLRLGQAEDALAIEGEIERRLRALARPDWHLAYINSLNLARIHKKLGGLDQAERCYAHAFRVTHHLRNESDLLYTNLCLAQLDELRGDHASAFVHRLRAALHWLSNPLPEALAPRVAQAVLGRPLANREADVEAISGELAARLRDAARREDIDATPFARPIPLHRIGPSSVADTCVGAAGWSVMTSTRDYGPAPFDGARYVALNRLAVGLLARLAQLPPGASFDEVRAILTDKRCGIELPATPREMLWSCLAWHVPVLHVGGRRCRVGQQAPAALVTAFTVQRSRAIDILDTGADTWQVRFKRYLPPRTLAHDEQACLARLSAPVGLAQLAGELGLGFDACIGLVQRMAQARLVEVS